MQSIMRQCHPTSLERAEWEKIKTRFQKYARGKQRRDARGVTSTPCFFSPTVFCAGSGDKWDFFSMYFCFSLVSAFLMYIKKKTSLVTQANAQIPRRIF